MENPGMGATSPVPEIRQESTLVMRRRVNRGRGRQLTRVAAPAGPPFRVSPNARKKNPLRGPPGPYRNGPRKGRGRRLRGRGRGVRGRIRAPAGPVRGSVDAGLVQSGPTKHSWQNTSPSNSSRGGSMKMKQPRERPAIGHKKFARDDTTTTKERVAKYRRPMIQKKNESSNSPVRALPPTPKSEKDTNERAGNLGVVKSDRLKQANSSGDLSRIPLKQRQKENAKPRSSSGDGSGKPTTTTRHNNSSQHRPPTRPVRPHARPVKRLRGKIDTTYQTRDLFQATIRASMVEASSLDSVRATCPKGLACDALDPGHYILFQHTPETLRTKTSEHLGSPSRHKKPSTQSDPMASLLNGNIFEFDKEITSLWASSPSKALVELRKRGTVEKSNRAIARYIFAGIHMNMLNKKSAGEFFGGEENEDVLFEFSSIFDFCYFDIDLAVRKFLQYLILPTESQQIERILQQFAMRYWECNMEHYSDADVVFMLSFSIMMLNTVMHNPMLKNKTTKTAFENNYEPVLANEDTEVPEGILSEIYDRILWRKIEYGLIENKSVILHDLAWIGVANGPPLWKPKKRRGRKARKSKTVQGIGWVEGWVELVEVESKCFIYCYEELGEEPRKRLPITSVKRVKFKDPSGKRISVTPKDPSVENCFQMSADDCTFYFAFFKQPAHRRCLRAIKHFQKHRK